MRFIEQHQDKLAISFKEIANLAAGLQVVLRQRLSNQYDAKFFTRDDRLPAKAVAAEVKPVTQAESEPTFSALNTLGGKL